MKNALLEECYVARITELEAALAECEREKAELKRANEELEPVWCKSKDVVADLKRKLAECEGRRAKLALLMGKPDDYQAAPMAMPNHPLQYVWHNGVEIVRCYNPTCPICSSYLRSAPETEAGKGEK